MGHEVSIHLDKMEKELHDNFAKVAPNTEMVDLGITKETSYSRLVKVEKSEVELWYQRDTKYVWKHAEKTDRNALYTLTGTQKGRLVVKLSCKNKDGAENLQGSTGARKNAC